MSFFAKYGEASRVVGFFPESEDTVAERIFDLHQRHAAAVCRVFDESVGVYASALREGKLPADCLLLLVFAKLEDGSAYATLSGTIGEVVKTESEIRIAIDAKRRRVAFERWGAITGVGAELLIALSEPFLTAMHDGIAPERYPFVETAKFMSQTKCDTEETLRKRVYRVRTRISEMASAAGDPRPSLDAVIENLQWHGYRLKPDRIRIVAASQLSGSE